LDKHDIERITLEIENENSLFVDKSHLDSIKSPSRIIGRQNKAKELARFLLGYKKGHVVPFISVYGRSGSGKSTVVKFVLENLDTENMFHRFVNLRKAKTVFGCANLILNEFGLPPLKSAQGLNVAIEQITMEIESIILKKEQMKKGKETDGSHKLFVLVLDEFDVIFYDKRTSPSDFIYKLLVMEEKLRQNGGYLVSIVAISNNVMSDYEVDDRVRSRIGSASEVFFGPYGKNEVLEILKDRADTAFAEKVHPAILEYCAEQSSQEHGDARRAIDLLRVAAEIAGTKGDNELTKEHIDMATQRLQKDRITIVLSSYSYHTKVACAALARITYVAGEKWNSTSMIYEEYCKILQKGVKPLSYRRVSELLTELENTGLVVSQTLSKGRHGYGSQYRLMVSPEMVGKTCFPDWWKSVVESKEMDDKIENLSKSLSSLGSQRRGRRFGLL
jgi:cell division control protein 6